MQKFFGQKKGRIVLGKDNKIQLFENQPIRTAWNEELEEWYFSIIDVVAVLTESKDANAYWRKLKQRLIKEGNETVTNCHALKMKAADGKRRLTDEWQAHGVQKGKEYAILTDEVTKAWSGMSTRQYKNYKGLKKENLRDNMSTLELALNMLAEATTTELTKVQNPYGLEANRNVAKTGGQIAGEARMRIEKETGNPVITNQNAASLNSVVTGMIEEVTKAEEKQ